RLTMKVLLHKDVLKHILSFLTIKNLYRLQKVCKLWETIIHELLEEEKKSIIRFKITDYTLGNYIKTITVKITQPPKMILHYACQYMYLPPLKFRLLWKNEDISTIKKEIRNTNTYLSLKDSKEVKLQMVDKEDNKVFATITY